MAVLKEQAIWENNIYQIEENDPVHGGEDGITNKPTKQLANRTLYLRNLLTLAGQKIVPKTITATSSNNEDATGHTHEIAHGTTGQKGIVQLTNDTGLDSESLALTAKAGKAIAQSVAQLQLSTTNALNQKVNKTDISNSVNSTSQTTVASSQAVKTAYDLASSKYTAQDANPTQKGLVQLADNLTTDDSNKALSAKQGKALKDEIDGIEVGGRNYLRNSANFNHITSNNQSIFQITKTVENGINVLTSTVVDSGSATFGKHYLSTYSVTLDNLTVLTDNLINQQLTVSVDVKSNVNTKIRLGYSNYQGAEFDLVAGQWQRIHYSFDAAQGFKRVPVFYNMRGEQEGGTVKIYHKNWMIEKSNRPSDWTPAPEDAEDYNRQNYVAKSGDTMTGILDIKNGNYSSINQWNLSSRHARSETLPDTDSNFFKISYRADNGNTELDAVHFPKRGVGKNVAYEDWVNESYVPRNGDTTINGRHFFKNNKSWISIISTASAESGIDFTNQNGKHAQASIRAVDVGGFADELRFLTTPPGSNYETDRRQHTMTLGYAGDLWTKKYGWLHDYFAKQADNNNIWNELNNLVIKRGDLIRSSYPSHYAGAEVYKIRHLGLMLTVMNTNGANGEYTLPEAYDGHAIALAQDRGDGRISLEGSRFLGGNKIKLAGRSDTNCHVLVIGFKNV